MVKSKKKLFLRKNSRKYKSKIYGNKYTKKYKKNYAKIQKGGAGASASASASYLPRDIKHFWYRDWPDHDAPKLDDPETKKEFVEFIDNLYNDIITDHGGTVIHCSAGVGRTGTIFVILKLCLEKGKNLTELLKLQELPYKEGRIEKTDIDNAIIYARIRRILLVQAVDQYNFLCDLFETKVKGDPNWKQIGTTYQPNDISSRCSTKNRYANVLPFDNNIVSLDDNEVKDCSNYINASYLNKAVNPCPSVYMYNENNILNNKTDDKFCKETTLFNGFVIATQGPLGTDDRTTIQDFLKMLAKPNLNIKRIVMLCNLDEKGAIKCGDYTNGPNNLNDIIEKQKQTKKQKQTNNYNKFELSLNVDKYEFKFKEEFTPRTIPIEPIAATAATPPVAATAPVAPPNVAASAPLVVATPPPVTTAPPFVAEATTAPPVAAATVPIVASAKAPVVAAAKAPVSAGPSLKEIKHFWYRDWTDDKEPDINDPNFEDFINILYNDIITNHGGTVIHCNLGTGRTGTIFIILKLCLEKRKNFTELLALQSHSSNIGAFKKSDIDNAIIYANIRRPELLETEAQYKFLLDDVFYVDENDSDEWDDIDITNQSIKISQKCPTKNRDSEIVPFDNNIVSLDDNKVKNCSNYINASYLNKDVVPCPDGIDRELCKETQIFNGVVIATQSPLIERKNDKNGKIFRDNTIQDFLKMLAKPNLNIKRIIMLCNLFEKKQEKCSDYTQKSIEDTSPHLGTLPYQGIDEEQTFGNIGIYEIPSPIIPTSKLIFKKPILIKELTKQILYKELEKDQNFEYVTIRDNGWCFYYAILQGLSDNPNIDAKTEDAQKLASDIADWFNDNDNKNKIRAGQTYRDKFNSVNWTIKPEFIGDANSNKKFDIDNPDDFTEFKNLLTTTQKNRNETNPDNDKLGPRIWGDFSLFGQAVADIKKVNFELYEIINDENLMLKKPAFTPQNGRSTQTLTLLITGNPQNHFDLLANSDASSAASAPVVTTPVVPTPAITTPAFTTHAVTTPAVTTPAVTTHAVTTPAVTTPAFTIPVAPTINEPTKDTLLKFFWYKKFDYNVNEFRLFINDLLTDIRLNKGGTVFHTKDKIFNGLVFVVLKICLENNIKFISNKIDSYKKIDIYTIIKSIKYANFRRVNMVNHINIFNFICSIFNITDNNTTYDNILDYLKDINFDIYNDCNDVEYNNDNDNNKPYDLTRVKIYDTDKLCENYINASNITKNIDHQELNYAFLDYLKKDNSALFNGDYIESECPLEKTKQTFISMLHKFNVKRIIIIEDYFDLNKNCLSNNSDYTNYFSRWDIKDHLKQNYENIEKQYHIFLFNLQKNTNTGLKYLLDTYYELDNNKLIEKYKQQQQNNQQLEQKNSSVSLQPQGQEQGQGQGQGIQLWKPRGIPLGQGQGVPTSQPFIFTLASAASSAASSATSSSSASSSAASSASSSSASTTPITPSVFGWDFDGVLHLEVTPMLNNSISRHPYDKTTLLAKKAGQKLKNHIVFNNLFENVINKLITNYNHFIITSKKDKEIIKNYKYNNKKFYSIFKNIITSANKINDLTTNKINYFFDDSNNHIISAHTAWNAGILPDLQKLYKVFPESVYDIYDHKNKPTDAIGTLNPIMVEVSKYNTNKIKILTYNINHDLKDTVKLKVVNSILKKQMDDNVDFICLQEFAYLDETKFVHETNKDGTPKYIPDFDTQTRMPKRDASGKIIYTSKKYTKYKEEPTNKQNNTNHPLLHLNTLENDTSKKISAIALNKYKYIYNHQAEHQFTFYDSEKYEIVIDNGNELIIRGRTSLYGRPFTLIVFNNKYTKENIILINVHFPQKVKGANVIRTNDMINNSICAWINNINDQFIKIPTEEFDSTKNALVKDKVKYYIKKTRIIMAGDFNRSVYSDSTKPNTYYSNKSIQHKDKTTGAISQWEIDNSAYGLKLFKGLFSDAKPKAVILYNIPLDGNTFSKSTCSGEHIDNVLDSFGLQINYEYPNDNLNNASDHLPVLVTLLAAKPLYDLNNLPTDIFNAEILETTITPPLLPPVFTPVLPVNPPISYCYV